MSKTIEGVDELVKKLKLLGDEITGKLMMKAMKKAAKPMLEASKRLAPERTGKLKDAIKIRGAKQYSPTNFAKAIDIGIGKKWFVGDDFYGAFQEYGWKQGKRKLGNKRKQIPGEHYIEYAFKETKDQVEKEMREELLKLIDKKVEQLGKQK